ncbi:AraC family transcriptional regulator [Aurantimonas sp. 22II-16-19i]|uniref:helix-turn-helix domain-containing protein n=1 Tax=Aurantimonas sp. 22II-16-19i TaxID=1317114 RepID=UPI0009F7C8ED|nr:AraC family transcriptional regulator [Aurantimonas sp. 22II-16-19i]ORE90371.1 AraC family transcriptional regulator [Aurantimonas sp. 22II-16-19i]
MLQRTTIDGRPRPVLAGPWADDDGGRIAFDLVTSARQALDLDPELTLHYLRRLEHLLTPTLVEAPRLQTTRDAAEAATARSVRGGLAAWQIRQVVRHIDAGLSETIRLDELAAVARLSNSHFSRAFRISLGETPHRFVMRRRIEEAQHLMLTTRSPLSRIAGDCGLTDQAHLTRLFRRFVGDTPLNWRRAHRQTA